MWASIVVTRSDGPLVRSVWEFRAMENMVVLERYAQERRRTSRHKFRQTVAYVRLSGGSQWDAKLSEADVPTPQDVFDEALEGARAQLKVGLWTRDFGRR